MARRGDPRCPMHVQPDIALVSHDWLARMDTHAHPNVTVSDRALRVFSGSDRVRRAREHNKESVSLCIDLDATMTSEGVTQVRPMLGELAGVGFRLLTQQSSR
jgi:hypothetical protein